MILFLGRILRIYRTLLGSDGKEYTRTEFVRKPSVIDAYVKIRTSEHQLFIKQFPFMDGGQKKEIKHEKQKIQDQLKRVIKNQKCETFSYTSKLKPSMLLILLVLIFYKIM